MSDSKKDRKSKLVYQKRFRLALYNASAEDVLLAQFLAEADSQGVSTLRVMQELFQSYLIVKAAGNMKQFFAPMIAEMRGESGQVGNSKAGGVVDVKVDSAKSNLAQAQAIDGGAASQQLQTATTATAPIEPANNPVAPVAHQSEPPASNETSRSASLDAGAADILSQYVEDDEMATIVGGDSSGFDELGIETFY